MCIRFNLEDLGMEIGPSDEDWMLLQEVMAFLDMYRLKKPLSAWEVGLFIKHIFSMILNEEQPHDEIIKNLQTARNHGSTVTMFRWVLNKNIEDE